MSKVHFKPERIGVFAAVLFGCTQIRVAGAMSPQQYSITNLGNFGGAATAKSINNNGDVVGYADVADGNTHAFFWSASSGIQDIGTVAGQSSSVAYSINDNDQVVGYSDMNGGGSPVHAFLWQPSSGMIDVGAATDTTAVADDINDHGQVVGTILTGQYNQNATGFIYTQSGGMSSVSIAGQPTTDIFAINNSGQMLLDSAFSENEIVYTPGDGMVTITSPTGTATAATKMNSSGTVAGSLVSTQLDGFINSHAFVWTADSGLVDLTPGYDSYGAANGVNDSGEVVGQAMFDGANPFAFIYEDGMMINLTALLGDAADGWTDMSAVGINDNGQIIGNGYYDGVGSAFLLTPEGGNGFSIGQTPEPGTVGMLVVGALVLMRRRERGARRAQW